MPLWNVKSFGSVNLPKKRKCPYGRKRSGGCKKKPGRKRKGR